MTPVLIRRSKSASRKPEALARPGNVTFVNTPVADNLSTVRNEQLSRSATCCRLIIFGFAAGVGTSFSSSLRIIRARSSGFIVGSIRGLR